MGLELTVSTVDNSFSALEFPAMTPLDSGDISRSEPNSLTMLFLDLLDCLGTMTAAPKPRMKQMNATAMIMIAGVGGRAWRAYDKV